MKIGGEGMTVEVDETLIFKRKNHMGRLLSSEVSQVWAFGGICRETGEVFVIEVPNRTAATLLEYLTMHVKTGTRIISDCWSAYNELSRYGFLHGRVNHSLNFVDPADQTIHTQTVERMWRSLKSILPKGTKQEHRGGYLAEFMFKQRNKWYTLNAGQRIEVILNALKKIKFN